MSKDDELVTTDAETFALFRAWLNTRRAEQPDEETRRALTDRLDQTGQTGGWLDPRPSILWGLTSVDDE